MFALEGQAERKKATMRNPGVTGMVVCFLFCESMAWRMYVHDTIARVCLGIGRPSTLFATILTTDHDRADENR